MLSCARKHYDRSLRFHWAVQLTTIKHLLHTLHTLDICFLSDSQDIMHSTSLTPCICTMYDCVLKVSVMLQDIDEKAEEAYRKMEDAFRIQLGLIPDGVAVT